MTESHAMSALIENLKALAPTHGVFKLDVADVTVIRSGRPTPVAPVVFRPSLYIVIQGAKQAYLEQQVLDYGAFDYLLLTVPLAKRGRVSVATKEEPYLALRIDLNMGLIAELIQQWGKQFPPAEQGHAGLAIFKVDDDIHNAIDRLVKAARDPEQAKIIGPQQVREVLFHVLRGAAGPMLYEFTQQDRHSFRIARALNYIQTNFNQNISVEHLADVASMSPSSFFHHFKTVTETSPQQFIKTLRLHEARRLLVEEQQTVGQAAFEVGYASPSQFSREFKRLFGVSPRNAVAPVGGFENSWRPLSQEVIKAAI